MVEVVAAVVVGVVVVGATGTLDATRMVVVVPFVVVDPAGTDVATVVGADFA